MSGLTKQTFESIPTIITNAIPCVLIALVSILSAFLIANFTYYGTGKDKKTL